MKHTRFLITFLLAVLSLGAGAQLPSPAYAANPFDKFGQDHNAALNEIIKLRTGDPMLIPALMPCYLPYFLKNNKYDADALVAIESNVEVAKRLDYDPARTPEEQLKIWAGKALITPQQFDFVSRIYKLVDAVEDRYYEMGGSAEAAYNDFKKSMTALEDEVLKGLSEKERDLVLATAATARYSMYYWMTQAVNQPSPWGTPPVGKAGLLPLLNWGSVGKADAAGAVGGAVKFGVAALFGGPVGWGAFGAAVVGGAVGGSVTSAIQQWWR